MYSATKAATQVHCTASYERYRVHTTPAAFSRTGADVYTPQYAVRCTATSNKGGSDTCMNNWCAASATGAPDTNGCGPQFKAAWSPAAAGAQPQNLTCHFTVPVHATGVRIHETNAAPFVKQVSCTRHALLS